MLQAFLALLLFIVMQLLSTLVAMLWYATNTQLQIDERLFTQALPAEVQLVALVASMVLTIALLFSLRLVRRRLVPRLPLAVPRRRVWRGTGWLVMGYFFTEKLVTLCGELLDLPNVYEAQFQAMMAYPLLMVVAVCFIGPVAEELVFREGVLRALHVWRSNKFWAVVLSALCFGVVHVNPAQIFSATLIGLLLGWVYVRTGDVRQSIFLHVLNNLTALGMGYATLTWGWADSYKTMLLSLCPPMSWWGEVAVLSGACVAVAAPALYGLYRWSKVAEPMPEREYFMHS